MTTFFLMDEQEMIISIWDDVAFNALFNNVSIGIVVADRKGNIRLANPCSEALFGYNDGELRGKPIRLLVPEETRDKHANFHENFYINPHTRPMAAGVNLYALKKSGERFPVDLSLSYFSYENETLAVVFIKDISEEKKAKEKFSKLFHQSPAGIVLSEAASGKIIDVNERFCSMAGYTKDELTGRTSKEIGFFLQHAEREKIVAIMNEKGRVSNYELEIRTKKNNTIYLLLSAEQIELDNQKYFLTTVLDITEKKFSVIKLRNSEENYRLIFNGMHDAFILQQILRDENKKITDLLIIDVNPVAEQLIGKKRNDMIGHMRSEFLGKMDEELRVMIDNIDGTKNNFKLHEYIPALDKWFNRTFFSPKAGQIVSISEEVTAEKKAQDALKKMNEELEEKVAQRTKELVQSLEREKELNEMKSRFVSTASHEFRTPLTAILSSMQLIEAYKNDEQIEKRNKHISRVKSSVKNLVEILNDFLSLEKVEHGKTDIIKENFNLHDFLQDIIEEINNILKEGQRIIFFYSGNETTVQDKKVLRHILLNLLSNAVKYSDNHKEIELTVKVENETACIHVKDNGIGIPEEEQKNLFGNFFRASNASNIQGTGLGLSIAKKYVELLNGNISFVSRHDIGTTFTVQLPVV